MRVRPAAAGVIFAVSLIGHAQSEDARQAAPRSQGPSSSVSCPLANLGEVQPETPAPARVVLGILTETHVHIGIGDGLRGAFDEDEENGIDEARSKTQGCHGFFWASYVPPMSTPGDEGGPVVCNRQDGVDSVMI